MDDKIYTKPMYKCGVCDTTYDDILERAKCEITCTKKKKEKERAVAAAKKEAEYTDRKKEVDSAFDNAYELREKFLKDYGSYTYRKSASNSSNLYLPFSWLW